MDFDKIVEKDGMYLCQDSSVNTITIRLNFLAGSGNRDCAIGDLLGYYLSVSNKNFKNDDEIMQRSKELYSLNYDIYNEYCSNQRMMSVDVNLISPDSIGVDYSKEAFEFIRQIINEPDFTKKEMFQRIIKNYLVGVRADLSDVEEYVDNMYNQMVIPEENREFDYSTDMKYITKVVKSITLEDLKKAYEYMINNFHSGFVYGNISEEAFNEFVDMMKLKRTQEKVSYEKNVPTIDGDVELDIDGEQSYIYVTYDIDGLSYAQVRILDKILNIATGLCYTVLRKKYGLVYGASASILYYLKKIYFYGEIDRDKKEQFIAGVEEIVNILQNKELLKRFIEEAKREIVLEEMYITEEQETIIGEVLEEFALKLYEGLNRNEVNSQIMDETADSLYNVTRSLRRKSIFMVRGMDNE